jgi:hypothetical protein
MRSKDSGEKTPGRIFSHATPQRRHVYSKQNLLIDFVAPLREAIDLVVNR